MRTVVQALLPVLAAGSGGLSGTVAVAVGALVVVLAIVLVFVMVLRSNGAARKTASGLGYDAQRGPLGQPQPDGGASPWQRQAMQQQAPGGWGQNGDFGGAGAAPPMGRPNAAAWGQTQDYPGGAGAAPGAGRWNAGQGQGGGWDAPASKPPAAAWGAPGSGPMDDPWQTGDGGWGGAAAPMGRPAAGAGVAGGAGGWGDPSAGSAPGAGGGPWGGAGNQAAAPWEQASAGASEWGAPPAAAGRPGAAPGSGMGWGPDMAPAPSASDWGAPAAARSDWNAAPAARPRQDWNAAPAAPQVPQGFQVAGGVGEVEKTHIVRPSTQQSVGMIVVRQGREPGRIFEVRKDRLTIGRSRESDIFLEDLAVSRLHTTVARDESGRYILRDENSANGTYVNGQRISEHVLDEGDEIQVGQTVLAFVRR